MVAPPVEAFGPVEERRGRVGGQKVQRAAVGQRDRHVPMRRGRRAAARPAPPGRGRAAVGVLGQQRPGQAVQGRRRKLRAAPASIGSRERSAMPPLPGNLPQPKASLQPAVRPSPSRSRPEGSPALTGAWKAKRIVDAVRPLAEHARGRRRALPAASSSKPVRRSTSGRAARTHRGTAAMVASGAAEVVQQEARAVAA